MLKKILPYLLAALVFFAALILLQPPEQVSVPVAAYDLPAGHVLVDSDLTLISVSQELAGSAERGDPASLIGETLKVARQQGDFVSSAHLGEGPLELAPGERAVAVTVKDASGIAGLISPGDRVGVSAVLFSSDLSQPGAFSKATIENLRVLYISPSFIADDPIASSGTLLTPDPLTGIAVQREREREGAVVLAVPIHAQVVAYDFQQIDPEAAVQERVVNAIELLAALEAADNAALSLYLMPKDADAFTTSGLWLPSLVLTPAPSLTPTATLTPTPGAPLTPTPAASPTLAP